MWCVKCNADLRFCVCPDLKERLASLAGASHVYIAPALMREWAERADFMSTMTPEQHDNINRMVEAVLLLYDKISSFELVGAPLSATDQANANRFFREKWEANKDRARATIAKQVPLLVTTAMQVGMVTLPLVDAEIIPNAAGVLMSFLKSMMAGMFNGSPQISQGYMSVRFEGIEQPFTQAPVGVQVIDGKQVEVEPALKTAELVGRDPASAPVCPFCLRPINLIANTMTEHFVQAGSPMLCNACGEVSVTRVIPGKGKVFQAPGRADLERWASDVETSASIDLARVQWKAGKFKPERILRNLRPEP